MAGKMTKQEILLLVGFILVVIAVVLFLWAWPLLSQGADLGLSIFLWALIPATVGGSLIVLGVLNGKN